MTTDFVPDDATFTAVLAVDDDAVGASRDVIYEDRFGTLHRIETERGADGNSVLKTETVIFSGDSAIEREFVIDHTVTVDGASNQTGQTLDRFERDRLGLDLGTLGNIVGSQIGAALGGNSVVGRIAAGTIVGTIAQNVGQFIQTAANASLTNSANGATIGNAAGLRLPGLRAGARVRQPQGAGDRADLVAAHGRARRGARHPRPVRERPAHVGRDAADEPAPQQRLGHGAQRRRRAGLRRRDAVHRARPAQHRQRHRRRGVRLYGNHLGGKVIVPTARRARSGRRSAAPSEPSSAAGSSARSGPASAPSSATCSAPRSARTRNPGARCGSIRRAAVSSPAENTMEASGPMNGPGRTRSEAA